MSGSIAFAVAVTNIIVFLLSSGDSFAKVVLNPSVAVLFVLSIMWYATAFWLSSAARWYSALLYWLAALVVAYFSVPGNVTSALFLMYAILLLVEFRVSKTAAFIVVPLLALAYAAALALGYRNYASTWIVNAAESLVLVLVWVTLYGIVILRHELRHRQEALTLETRVKERTAEIESALEERQVMLREIHHRVKNNLQVVASLLRLESAKVHDPVALGSLESSVQRIHAMALVHETLYESEALHRVELSGYAKELVGGIGRTLEGPLDIRLEVHDEIAVDPDFAIPFGLLLTELVTNAAKFAYPLGSAGIIRVDLACGELIVLEVADEGVGMPPDFELAVTTSLGLTIVRSIVEQLGGTIELVRTNGTKWIVRLDATKTRRAIS